MKTVVKIDPEKEYQSAKSSLVSLARNQEFEAEVSTLDNSIDNLKTVINVLIERATPKKIKPPKKNKRKKKKKSTVDNFDKIPSEKFPDLEVKEEVIEASEPPKCACCQHQMTASGLYKTSEKLEVIPKQYFIKRHKRVIYNCSSCNGSMTNVPSVPSINRFSNYGDSLIIDVALSKYCDLLPIERYSAMAARDGVDGLPPNSLIGLTHILADFLNPIYEKIKEEILLAKVLLVDETPHKMLEGDDTKNWYLWGFSSIHSCYFEAHPTRSGDVPIDFLENSDADFLLTDGFGGYKRAIRVLGTKGRVIQAAYCNAHSVRYFKEASSVWHEEAEPFLKLYGKIYKLEKEAQESGNIIGKRSEMKPHFAELKGMCEKELPNAMPESAVKKALDYFLNHYQGLTRFIDNPCVPIDNNQSERQLRSPVVGRKTWAGTHSKRGAKTAATIFSLVESCKLIDINPRKYFTWITNRILYKQETLTPSEYAKLPSGSG